MSDFPESDYQPEARLEDRYRECVRLGYERMRQTPVVVCGLARNVEPFLPATIKRVEQLVSLFSGHSIVIYENDSTDQTLPLLREWEAGDGRIVVISDRLNLPVNPGTRCPARGDRMADARNRYLDMVRQHFSHIPFTIVVDTDLVGGWSFDGIAHTFGRDGWDMVGSNGILHQYNPRKRLDKKVQFDAWAFRKYNDPEPRRAAEVNALDLRRGEPLIPMLSCFGGLGVYKTEAILKSRYAGGDCEHVPFHRGIVAAGGKIFLNPSQIVLYGQRDW